MSDSKDLSPSEKMRAAIPDAPPKSRVHTGLAIFTGMLTTFLVIAGCACGISAWWFRPQIREDSELAKTLTREIVNIDIPEFFQPHGTIEWNLAFTMQLRGVYYQRYVGDGILTLLEVKSQLSNEEAIRSHIRKTLLEEAAGGTELIIDHSKTYRETFPLAGQDVSFSFEQARDGNEIFHLAEGVFEGKAGQVLLSLRVDDLHWKTEEDFAAMSEGAQPYVVPIWLRRMIESIGKPIDPESSSRLQTPQPLPPLEPTLVPQEEP